MALSIFLIKFLCTILFMLVVFDRSAAAQGVPDEPQNDRKPGFIYANTGKTTEGSQFQHNVEAVIEFFRENNPPNGYATCLGYGSSNDTTVYGHSACYNMSTQPHCSMCIKQAYDAVQQTFSLTLGATYWINDSAIRCRLRYETYSLEPYLALLGVIGPNGSAPPVPAPVAPRPSPQPATPVFVPPTPAGSNTNRHRSALVWGPVGGGVGFAFLLIILGCFVWRSKRHTKLDKRHKYQGPADLLEGSIEGPLVFRYADLLIATGNFSETHKLGQGGFGTVYKATLQGGAQVAVKKLSLHSKQGKKEFVNEISIITSIQHRNLVRLKGYCIDKDERIIVYEFFNNGSLDRALFSSKASILSWQSRFQIAIGIARGLAYLHEESQIQIIHRDIKASNILLDDKLQPKISDFGLSKLFEGTDTTSTKVAGTLGYMAPEYVTRGRLTFKTDVFSYGILLLEIVSGRKCMDPSLPADEELLLQLVWNLYKSGNIERCVDQMLGSDYVKDEASRLIHVALLCTQGEEDARPGMSDVVAMLQGYLEIGHDLDIEAPLYVGRVGATGSSTSSSDRSITQVSAR